MQVSISGQNLEITPALREYVSDKLERVSRHIDNVMTAHVVLRVEKTRHLAEATVSASKTKLHATAEAADMYAAIDLLADKLQRQLLKHKEKRNDHHQHGGALKKQVLE